MQPSNNVDSEPKLWANGWPEGRPPSGLGAFGKLCAALAFILGIVLLLLGLLGLFTGCSANFRLPPVLGVLPAFVGWGIINSVCVAWRIRSTPPGRP